MRDDIATQIHFSECDRRSMAIPHRCDMAPCQAGFVTVGLRAAWAAALFNVALHENLIALAHVSYFPTIKCKAMKHKT